MKKVKNKKINVKFIIILLIFIFTFSFSYFKSDFKKLVLNKISNAKLMDIGRKDIHNSKREQNYVEDYMKIEEFKNMLSNLKLIEVKSIPKKQLQLAKMSYYVDVILDSFDKEYIYLQLYKPSKYIIVDIKNKNYNNTKIYKIINGDIDFDLLDKLIINLD